MAAVTAHPGYTRLFEVELETPGIRIPLTKDATLWAESVKLGKKVIWTQTFGRAFADDKDRPFGKVAYPKDNPSRVSNLQSVKEFP
ncbi:type ISP restriction/modification enzyme [Mycobacterium sp. JS623]|uniref:type ISP restriction/modification enzyme n=1 Tax=Mycobacterium sp. JS623 TaxID=212767 RepID=UPI000307707E|nr:type ISP restriction/modification enzyme [Mycobacterium sp. JS623]